VYTLVRGVRGELDEIKYYMKPRGSDYQWGYTYYRTASYTVL
jgi:hypothetical protein